MKDKSNNDYAEEQVVSIAPERKLVWRLLGYLRPFKKILSFALVLLLISKVIEAVVPVFIGDLSQKILNSLDLDGADKALLLKSIFVECFVLLVLVILSFAFDFGNIILRSWIGQKSLYTFRRQIYEHVLRMPLAYFDRNSIGRLMTRTIHDVDQINLMFAESVIPILGSIFLFISIFICIVVMDWKIAVFMLFVLPMVWGLTHHFRLKQRRNYERIRTVVSAMNTFIQEHLMGASIVRNFGLQAKAKFEFEKINMDHCNANFASINQFGLFIAGIDFLQNFCLIIAFALLAMSSIGEQGFQAGVFFTFSLYVVMFFRPLSDLAERYNILQSAMAAASRIFSVLDTQSEKSVDLGKMHLKHVQTIAFEDVWFAYEKENWILKGISFQIEKGESAAIVGMTGEGKSTILSLLMRFYEIQKGAIKINGNDIRQYTMESLREQFSVVLQDPVIFSGSIAQNISMFNPMIDSKQINSVLNYLGIASQMDRFPGGLDYELKEQGKGLSSGEKQLISLARAAVSQRSVLVLDEATTNIDTKTEQIIQEALKKVIENMTSIVIAHRFSTIRDVSLIMVLHGGRIVETGTHEHLMANKGIYEKLYRLQFKSI